MTASPGSATWTGASGIDAADGAGSPAPGTAPPAGGTPGATGPRTFDATSRHGLHPQVALRPEPFGALAYHYGNRRLTFVRSQEVVDLLRDLDRHPSVTDAVTASGIEPRRHPSVLRALDQLWRSEVIRAC